MAMKRSLVSAVLAACLVLMMAWGTARAEDIPLVTGEHWTRSSEQVKKAYLVGIANVIQLERAYAAANPPSEAQSTLPRFGRGLKGQTLDSVREALDAWYAAHPDRLQRPVLETIWFEMVVPGLQKNP